MELPEKQSQKSGQFWLLIRPSCRRNKHTDTHRQTHADALSHAHTNSKKIKGKREKGDQRCHAATIMASQRAKAENDGRTRKKPQRGLPYMHATA